ncbi:MAG: hypothetical protein ACPH14_07150 [Candidatus Puniceispirillaceae bacterium]
MTRIVTTSLLIAAGIAVSACNVTPSSTSHSKTNSGEEATSAASASITSTTAAAYGSSANNEDSGGQTLAASSGGTSQSGGPNTGDTASQNSQVVDSFSTNEGSVTTEHGPISGGGEG